MRIRLLFTTCLIQFSVMNSLAQQVIKTACAEDSPSLKLVWSDEFNGEGAPDPAKWDELGYIRNNG